MVRSRGGLTTPDDRQKALEILEEGITAGARASELAKLMGVGISTLQRWRRLFAGDGEGVDGRKSSARQVAHQIKYKKLQRYLISCNDPQCASLPTGKIVPDLADQRMIIGSESSIYRILHGHGQLIRRGRGRLPQERRPVPRLRATGPNQVWSWNNSYLPTNVK